MDDDPRLQQNAYIKCGRDLYRVLDIETKTEGLQTTTVVWLEHAVTDNIRRIGSHTIESDFELVRAANPPAIAA